jgi:undecaprenyl-diphosphatase
LAATPSSSRFPHALSVAGIAAALLVAAGTLSHLAGDASLAYRALREAMGGLPDWLWSDLTFFGFGLTAANLVGLVRDRSMRFFAVSLWGFALGTLAIQIVKRTLVTPRPLTLLPDLPPIGAHLFWGSMPSGHAATALGLAATFLLVRSRSWRSVAVLIVVATAVAFSRVAVGAHWIGDVLVGAGIGLAAAAAGVAIERRVDLARRLATPYGQLAVAAVQIVVGVLMVWKPLGYPLAEPLQWLVGLVGIGAGLHRLWQMRAPPARIGVAP